MVLHLDVHPHLPARIQGFVKRRYVCGKLVFGEMGDDATVSELGVVVHHQLSASTLPHIEFDGVGTHLPRTNERRQRIGALGLRRPTVGHDLCGFLGAHGALATPKESS